MTKSGIKNKMQGISAAILADTKAANQGEGVAPTVAEDGLPTPRAPRTAPGHMFAHVGQIRERDATIKDLEQRLAKLAGSILTKKIAAELIDPSKWANRHAKSFETKSFEEFKKEIANANGNIQPILVRTVGERYEVVFGHRRLAACQQLGLPVLAMVMELSDKELFSLMDRENRSREDLSPYEQGAMWAKALASGMFSSARQLGSEIGVSHAFVSQCLAVSELPVKLVSLFSSPTEVQIRWAVALQRKLKDEPEEMAKRIKHVQSFGKHLPAVKVYDLLVGKSERGMPKEFKIQHNGKTVGKFTRHPEGKIVMTINDGLLSQQAFEQLKESISGLMGT